jgi:nicotinamide riboside kinase
LGEGRKGVVADTDLTVIKIWAEDKFKNVPLILELAWEAQQYDHYLLCKPDIPWEADPLRENPKDRDRLFGMYENYLKAKGLPFTIVHGSEEGRWSIVEEVIKTIP